VSAGEQPRAGAAHANAGPADNHTVTGYANRSTHSDRYGDRNGADASSRRPAAQVSWCRLSWFPDENMRLPIARQACANNRSLIIHVRHNRSTSTE